MRSEVKVFYLLPSTLLILHKTIGGHLAGIIEFDIVNKGHSKGWRKEPHIREFHPVAPVVGVDGFNDWEPGKPVVKLHALRGQGLLNPGRILKLLPGVILSLFRGLVEGAEAAQSLKEGPGRRQGSILAGARRRDLLS